MKKFTIEVEMQERWVSHFMSMLVQMEYLGNIGSSSFVTIYSDGDGDFTPKFKTDIDFEIFDGNPDEDGNTMFDAG